MTADMEQPGLTPSMATKLLLGIFLAFLGLVMTGDNLDLFDGDRILQYWSVILIAAGLVKLFQAGNAVLSLLLIVAGTWILAFNLGWFPFTVFDLWPVILIAIGLGMIGRSFRGNAGAAVTTTASSDGGVAILSTRQIQPRGAWRGGRFAAILGSCEIDLTAAELGPDPAVIDVLTFWGGVIVTVPDGCEVIGDVVPIMGGFETKTGAAFEPTRRVLVRGLALMAGVEVKNPKRSDR